MKKINYIFHFSLFVLFINTLHAQTLLPELMYYKFDAISGGVIANHAPALTQAGTGGTITGNLNISGTGQFGTGLTGTGSTSTANFFNTGWNTNLTGSWTLSCWVGNVSSVASRYLFGDATSSGLRCYTNGGNVLFRGPATIDIPGAAASPSVVHYVYDAVAGTVTGYHNGVPVASVTVASPLTITGTTPFKIGASTSTGIAGVMDEFRMYNRALTANEISLTWDKDLAVLTLPGNDAGLASVTAPQRVYCAGSHDIKVKLINQGGNVINNVQVHWSVDGILQTPVTWNTPVSNLAVNAAASEVEVTLGSVSFGRPVRVVKAWTTLPNGSADPVAVNDTISVLLKAGMDGAYTVGGSGADYATPGAAAVDLNKYGVCGPVVFSIRNGTYNERLTLDNVAGVSDINTITFRSESGNPNLVTITDAADGTVFMINKTPYVRLQNLSIINTVGGTPSSCYALLVEGPGSARMNTLVVDSCILGTPVPAGTTTLFATLYISGSGLGNDTFRNNTIYGGRHGFYYNGPSPEATGFCFAGNIVKDVPTSLTIRRVAGAYIKNNTLENTSEGMVCQYAIGGNIRNNKINATTRGMSVLSFTGADTNEMVIANNVIYMDMVASLNPSTVYFGLNINGDVDAAHTKIYNNTVNLANLTVGNAAALDFKYSSGTGGTDNEVFNNVFAHNGGGVSLLLNNISQAAAAGSMVDYNLLYTTGSVLAQYGTTAFGGDIASWRAASGFDQHSVSYRPAFMSTNDLRPDPADTAAWAMNGRGIQLRGNTADIDGNSRPDTVTDGVPDLGAYEFTPSSVPPLALATPAAPAAGTTQLFTFAGDTVARIAWSASASVPASVQVRQYTGEVSPGAAGKGNHMYYYTRINAPAGSYSYDASFYYKAPWLGTVADEAGLRLAHAEDTAQWRLYAGTQSNVDTLTKVLSKTGLSSFFFFTGTDCMTMKPDSIAGPLSLCGGTTGVYTVPSFTNATGYTWILPPSWTGSSTTNSITATAGSTGGNISVVAHFSCGTGDTQVLAVVATAQPGITASGSVDFCPGDSVLLYTDTATGRSYQWQRDGAAITGATGSAYSADTTGSYRVVVTGGACPGTSLPVAVSVYPAPVPVISRNGDVLQTGNFASWQWYRDGQAVNGANSQSYTMTANGEYHVAVTDANGCTGRSAVLSVTDVSAVGDVAAVSGLKLYPNPVRDLLMIENGSRKRIHGVRIFSMTGMQVVAVQEVTDEMHISIPVHQLAPGIYTVSVLSDDGIWTRRVSVR